MTRRIWFERRFQLGLPAEAFPDVMERLRGTPARLEERLRDLDRSTLTRRADSTWSIQRNVGHLLDLEELWVGRVGDFEAGVTQLRPADLTNQATDRADHDERDIAGLLASFREARARFVQRAEGVASRGMGETLLHPRLLEPMNLVDHVFFVAEHDDHHLARISELLRSR